MVAPKRQCIPRSVGLLTKQTFSILGRSHLFLNIILLDSLISHPQALLPGEESLLTHDTCPAKPLEYGRG